ncbi:MAG: hypothetical protein U5R14_14800 [Gemmatimonadota bacterium]|nr:hypothetical protein [Gemmatimonadota bacterium]
MIKTPDGPRSDTNLIGTPNRKVEGLDKSTGRAVYTDDIQLPGMLHGKILRSPHPHARIVSIDTSEAERLEGVHAVVTGRDMETTYGIIPLDAGRVSPLRRPGALHRRRGRGRGGRG